MRLNGSFGNRNGLIEALHAAAELRYGFMLQYFFAALTLKKRVDDDGPTPAQQELVRGWAGRLLRAAREEIAHLGTVRNFLIMIGSGA